MAPGRAAVVCQRCVENGIQRSRAGAVGGCNNIGTRRCHIVQGNCGAHPSVAPEIVPQRRRWGAVAAGNFMAQPIPTDITNSVATKYAAFDCRRPAAVIQSAADILGSIACEGALTNLQIAVHLVDRSTVPARIATERAVEHLQLASRT